MKQIKNFSSGDKIKGFFICVDKTKKISRYGDMFLDLILKNKTGTIRGKLWKHTNYFLEKFDNGDIVAIKGTVITFRKVDEIKIDFINKAEKKMYQEYGFVEKSFI